MHVTDHTLLTARRERDTAATWNTHGTSVALQMEQVSKSAGVQGKMVDRKGNGQVEWEDRAEWEQRW